MHAGCGRCCAQFNPNSVLMPLGKGKLDDFWWSSKSAGHRKSLQFAQRLTCADPLAFVHAGYYAVSVLVVLVALVVLVGGRGGGTKSKVCSDTTTGGEK